MRYSDSRTSACVKRWVEVTDGPVIDMINSSSGKKIKVERVVLNYWWKEGEWVVTSWSDVDLIGPVLKKDGTPGKQVISQNPPYGWPRNQLSVPWLSRILNIMRPVGEPMMVHGHFEHDLEADL